MAATVTVAFPLRKQPQLRGVRPGRRSWPRGGPAALNLVLCVSIACDPGIKRDQQVEIARIDVRLPKPATARQRQPRPIHRRSQQDKPNPSCARAPSERIRAR
jgi:hypothetical protein